MKKRIGILMGGPSSEYEVSIKSGKAVYNTLLNKGYDVVSIELEKDTPNDDYEKKVIDKIRSCCIDIAFVALHGEFGEDGRIQNILEKMKLPYTGSKAQASKAGMDKICSKKTFFSNNIPTPDYEIVEKRNLENIKSLDLYFNRLGAPIVVKPYDKGSSIGMYIVDNAEGLSIALENAFKCSSKILLESYIKGRELTVGILEDKPLPIVEIVPKNKFFDYDAKYNKGFTEYIVPAKIDKKTYLECQKIALLAHKALGARSFSRVDIMLDKFNKPFVLELNTIPGLTETSLLPKAAKDAGVDFESLALKILESAAW